jgi:serine/threonine-protein kinase
VKVIDFGIAKELRSEGETELTTTGAMLGTLHYMAPEQVFGDVDIDERADVWALGVVLYECLAGRRPTEGSGSGQVLKAIMTRTFTPLAAASPGCPAPISDLVARMLSRERAERPSLDEVVDTLEGRATRAPRSVKAVAAEETSAPRSRSVMVGALVGLAAVGVMAGAARFVLSSTASPSGSGAVSALAQSSPPPLGSPASVGALPSAGSSAPLGSAGVDPLPAARAVTVTSAKVVVVTGPKAGASTSVKAVGVAPRAVAPSTATPTAAPPAASSSGSPALPPLATSRRS